METVNPSEDTENRLSHGGKKRSSRRSSILKPTKSPVKMVLEDIDPNCIGIGKENTRDKRKRSSSNRRVSFAETFQVKEFCKDDEWYAIWQRENSNKNTGQEKEEPVLPSEYRQPTETIKGLESLLKGDIQNTEQDLQNQDNPTMDFTFCVGNLNKQVLDSFTNYGGKESLNKEENIDQMKELELTCHGQGLIKQDDEIPPTTTEDNPFQCYQPPGSRQGTCSSVTEYPNYIQTSRHSQTEGDHPVKIPCNKENETMDFTVCHRSRYEEHMYSQATMSKDRTVVFNTDPRDDLNSLELTCHGQGLINQITSNQSTQGDVSSCSKSNPSSFLQSLRQSQPKENYRRSLIKKSYIDNEGDEHSLSPSVEQKQGKIVEKTNAKSFLASLSKSKLVVSKESFQGTNNVNEKSFLKGFHSDTEVIDSPEPEDDMEMTTCLDVEAANNKPAVNTDAIYVTAYGSSTANIEDTPFLEEAMDMTACLPPASRAQGLLEAISEGQMDMTACVPPSRLQDDSTAISEGQMDMTTCVPPSSRLQGHSAAISSEGQMDMTTCVPPSSRLQGHSAAISSEGQMDLTTCVPPSSRLQNHFEAISEGQMDMTACVPPNTRLQGHSAAISSEGQMNMTACVPPNARLQGHSVAISSEGQMDMTACVSPSRLEDHSEAISEGQMNMTACVPPTSKPYSIVFEDKDHVNNSNGYVQEPEGIEMTKSVGKVQLPSEDGNVCTTPDGMDMTKSYTTSKDNNSQTLTLMEEPLQSNKLSPKYQTENRKRHSSSSIESCLSGIPCVRKKQVEGQQEQKENPPDFFSNTKPFILDSLNSFKKNLKNSNQSCLNRTMPILGIQETQTKYLKSLPALSRSLMECDGTSSKSIPHATFAPVSNVPISKFCSQPAIKRKMIQINNQDLPTFKEGVQGFLISNSQKIGGQGDENPNDTSKPADTAETLHSDQETQQDDDDVHGDDDDGDDGVITFKHSDPASSLAGPSNANQIEDHLATTGLMEEPTLEMDFTDQSALLVESDNANATSSHEGEEEAVHTKNESFSSQHETHDQSQGVAKQQARNLSTICEESEMDNSKVAGQQMTFAGKQDQAINQKSLTVAELLSRANISFQNVGISRRSTTAFMKKAEKPKEEREFIQLSLVTKPQATHYGDICTNIQKELGQLKTKMEEQELKLNESNASILQQTNDSEMAKLERKLKELKNVCKKCAYQKWITRTAAMKKKLAFTLKENHEMLSNDVRTINETLLVTNDCTKLIDGIENEIEKGIESLNKSLEDSEKENAELAEVKALLEHKIPALETREVELKQVEDQRSTLLSTRETLSSEKETLEREQLEYDEILSKLKNKAASHETNESLSEKYKLLEGCLEWELTEWDQNHAKFLFLYDTLELKVDFDQSSISENTQSISNQPAIKQIKNISLSSHLADDSLLSARFVHSLVVNSLDSDPLLKERANTTLLPKVLEHVSELVITARSLGNELFELNLQNILTMNENSIFVEFSSVKAFIKFVVQFRINVFKYPDKVDITVIPKIGKCCAKDIQDALTSVPTGPKYVSRLVNTARQFLDPK